MTQFIYLLKILKFLNFIKNQYNASDSQSIKRWAKEFMDKVDCSACEGSRLRKESCGTGFQVSRMWAHSGLDDFECHVIDLPRGNFVPLQFQGDVGGVGTPIVVVRTLLNKKNSKQLKHQLLKSK